MDITSVAIGSEVRNGLREYRDRNDHPNYNEAIKSLLSQADESEELEVAA